MYTHTYVCRECNGNVKIKSTVPMNPLRERLHTHKGVMSVTERNDDPFLAGAEIDATTGSQGSRCSGGLMYRGHAAAPPEPAKHAAAAPLDGEAAEVYADMNRQFKKWDGSSYRRGGYWGGSHANAKTVPTKTVNILKARCVNSNWVYSGSDSGGISFHRRGPSHTMDFIYHMSS